MVDNSSIVGSVSTFRIRRETFGTISTGSDVTGEIAMGELRTTGTGDDLLSTRIGCEGALRAIDVSIFGGCGTCEVGRGVDRCTTREPAFGSRSGVVPAVDRGVVLWLR